MSRSTTEIKASEFVNAFGDGNLRDLSSRRTNAVLIQEEVVIDATSTEDALTKLVPGGTVVEGYKVQSVDGVTITTATHFAVGTTADPDELGKTAVSGNLAAAFSEVVVPGLSVYYASDQEIALTPTNSSGVKGNSFSGTVRVLIWGYRVPSIEQAATPSS